MSNLEMMEQAARELLHELIAEMEASASEAGWPPRSVKRIEETRRRWERRIADVRQTTTHPPCA